MMLFKLINRQLFSEVNGCISTGKEANVYHACRADGTECAIKVCSESFVIIIKKNLFIKCSHKCSINWVKLKKHTFEINAS